MPQARLAHANAAANATARDIVFMGSLLVFCGDDATRADDAEVRSAVVLPTWPATFCSPLRAGARRARRPGSTLAAAFARQHLVHHLAGEPEIGAGVAHLLELRAREMPRDIGILRQQIDQRLPARRDVAANVLNEVVPPLAPEMPGHP